MRKRRRATVRYRENCGGVLQDLARGFRKQIKSFADIDLYHDLRERILRQDATLYAEKKKLP